jgi:DNA replication and repair protein RecF
MHIKKIQILGVRNLKEAIISPNNQINIFTGRNASGKTSVLEAIHILARSKSFRTPRIRDVITHKSSKLLVAANFDHEKHNGLKLKVEKGGKTNTQILNGEKLKTVSELAKTFPFITITQDSQQIIVGTPKQRRHWLDWAMFHVEPGYLACWKQYFRALRHRNILLKKGERKVEIYRPWEEEMVKLSTEISEKRKQFINQISHKMNEIFVKGRLEKTGLEFKQGWDEEITFEEYLQTQRGHDRERGYTRNGPQQADVIFRTEAGKIKDIFSRGQIKIYINQLLMSQAQHILDTRGVRPIILIDDYTAELDKYNSEYLLYFIKNQRFQAFITTTEFPQHNREESLFHVEQGQIRQISG